MSIVDPVSRMAEFFKGYWATERAALVAVTKLARVHFPMARTSQSSSSFSSSFCWRGFFPFNLLTASITSFFFRFSSTRFWIFSRGLNPSNAVYGGGHRSLSFSLPSRTYAWLFLGFYRQGTYPDRLWWWISWLFLWPAFPDYSWPIFGSRRPLRLPDWSSGLGLYARAKGSVPTQVLSSPICSRHSLFPEVVS